MQEAQAHKHLGQKGSANGAATAAQAYLQRMLATLTSGGTLHRGQVVHTPTMSAVCLRGGEGWQAAVTVFWIDDGAGLVRHQRHTGTGAQLLFDAICQLQAR